MLFFHKIAKAIENDLTELCVPSRVDLYFNAILIYVWTLSLGYYFP